MPDVLDVDDEDKGVVLLNLLHGGLGVQWVEEDGAGIEARFVLRESISTRSPKSLVFPQTYVDGLAGVFWSP